MAKLQNVGNLGVQQRVDHREHLKFPTVSHGNSSDGFKGLAFTKNMDFLLNKPSLRKLSHIRFLMNTHLYFGAKAHFDL